MKALCSFLGGFAVSIMLGLVIVYNINHYNGRMTKPLPIPTAKDSAAVHLDTVQLDCMARNIFFEARGESAQGKAMVGLVVLQRMQSPHFPSTICGVVHQARKDSAGRVLRNKCQFSWYCSGKTPHINFENVGAEKEWEQSYIVAKLVMLGKIKENVDMTGVTHYHKYTIKPFWARNRNYKVVARVGDHIFYRWSKATLPKWTPTNVIAMN